MRKKGVKTQTKSQLKAAAKTTEKRAEIWITPKEALEKVEARYLVNDGQAWNQKDSHQYEGQLQRL